MHGMYVALPSRMRTLGKLIVLGAVIGGIAYMRKHRGDSPVQKARPEVDDSFSAPVDVEIIEEVVVVGIPDDGIR